MLLLLIIVILLCSGGGYYGYRREYYGGRGIGLIGVLVIVLIAVALFGQPAGWY
jgi:hypothetical protein